MRAQTGKQSDRHRHRHTHKERDTDRQTHTHTHAHTHTHILSLKQHTNTQKAGVDHEEFAKFSKDQLQFRDSSM